MVGLRNHEKFEGTKTGFGMLIDQESSLKLRTYLQAKFQMQSYNSSLSSSRVKRTFSRDLFHVDRGKLRARRDER